MNLPERIGRYDVIELVGRGGMGVLYRGHDPVLDRDVAIKVLSSEYVEDEQQRALFHREARAAARLQHRNIVTIHEFGEHDGRPYMVMEFLHGSDLQRRMRTPPPIPLDQKLDFTCGLLSGLGFAHDHGVVHRDVKPANVWILEDGSVKLLDFGIAKLLTSASIFRGGVMGTVPYMSPEQVGGKPVDGRSDIFSAAVVLYELLSGKRPFDGQTLTEVMVGIIERQPPPIPDLPPALARMLGRALEKNPDSRYQTAITFAGELQVFREGIRPGSGASVSIGTSPVRSGGGGHARGAAEPTLPIEAESMAVGSPSPTVPIAAGTLGIFAGSPRDAGAFHTDASAPLEGGSRAPELADAEDDVEGPPTQRYAWVLVALFAVIQIAAFVLNHNMDTEGFWWAVLFAASLANTALFLVDLSSRKDELTPARVIGAVLFVPLSTLVPPAGPIFVLAWLWMRGRILKAGRAPFWTCLVFLAVMVVCAYAIDAMVSGDTPSARPADSTAGLASESKKPAANTPGDEVRPSGTSSPPKPSEGSYRAPASGSHASPAPRGAPAVPAELAPVRVGGDIPVPTKTRDVKPVYPVVAQSARVQGVVIIEATIAPDGTVTDARVLRSISLLDQAALDAVLQWEFTPTLIKGVAVPVIMTVTVNFALE